MLNEFIAEQCTDDDPPPEPHAEEELPDDDHNCESTHIEQVHNENPDIAELVQDFGFKRLFKYSAFSWSL